MFQRYVIALQEIKTCVLLISVRVCLICKIFLKAQRGYLKLNSFKCIMTKRKIHFHWFFINVFIWILSQLKCAILIPYHHSVINIKELILVINYFKVEWKIIKVKSRQSEAIQCLLNRVRQTFHNSRDGRTERNSIHEVLGLRTYNQWSNYGGAREGGLAPLVVLMAPLVQLIFMGSGGAAKRPS